MDVRFTTKGGVPYAIVMCAPEAAGNFKSLGIDSKRLNAKIADVSLLGGSETVRWSQTGEALTIEAMQEPLNEIATGFEISTQ